MNDELLGKKKAAMRITHSAAPGSQAAPQPVRPECVVKRKSAPKKDEFLPHSPLKLPYYWPSLGLLTDSQACLRHILVT